MLGVINVVLGAGLLLAGRKLFWFLVGAIGFMVGLELAQRIQFRSELVLILASLAIGVLFALLAVFVETVAIGIAGFFGGGLVFLRLAALLGLDSPVARTTAFILGAIIGVACVIWLFNVALVVISSAAGASMVASGLVLTDIQRPLLFLALFVIGVVVQFVALGGDRREPQPPQAT